MKRDLLDVVVLSNGQRIGVITPAQLFAAAGVNPKHTTLFLSTIAAQFNAGKERLGEPERVEIHLRGK